MTLGEFITDYCKEHGYSVRQFASLTGYSHTYISVLINGRPGSGKRPSPTIDTYRNIAAACGLTLDELLAMVHDDYVVLNPNGKEPAPGRSELFEELAAMFNSLSEADQQKALGYLAALRDKDKS